MRPASRWQGAGLSVDASLSLLHFNRPEIHILHAPSFAVVHIMGLHTKSERPNCHAASSACLLLPLPPTQGCSAPSPEHITGASLAGAKGSWPCLSLGLWLPRLPSQASRSSAPKEPNLQCTNKLNHSLSWNAPEESLDGRPCRKMHDM